MSIARPLEPPGEEIPFGDMVANESLAHQAILEQLRPFYPQIRRVINSATLQLKRIPSNMLLVILTQKGLVGSKTQIFSSSDWLVRQVWIFWGALYPNYQ